MKDTMRHSRQALSETECNEILSCATSGVLNLLSDTGYTYGVPLSYSYENGKIYFHSGEGKKTRAVAYHDKVSFTVIQQDKVVKEEYTTYYKSVIVFGRIHLSEDREEKYHAITSIARKYYPEDSPEHLKKVIEREFDAMWILVLDIEKISGKQARELCKKA